MWGSLRQLEQELCELFAQHNVNAKESKMPSPRRVSQILKGKKIPKPKTVNAMAKRASKKK